VDRFTVTTDPSGTGHDKFKNGIKKAVDG